MPGPELARLRRRFGPLLLVALVLFVFLGVDHQAVGAAPEAFVTVDGEALGNSEAVAWTLYRDYLLPFEIASVFLLVAMTYINAMKNGGCSMCCAPG